MFTLRHLFVILTLTVPAAASFGQTADVVRAGAGLAAPLVAPDLTGSWTGCWLSCKNGHKGPLQAEFCKLNDTCYRVTFRGRFWAILPFRYTTTMAVTGYTADGQVMLSSNQRLGPILGSFCMNATASACHFDATFQSKNDHGKFVLNRK